MKVVRYGKNVNYVIFPPREKYRKCVIFRREERKKSPLFSFSMSREKMREKNANYVIFLREEKNYIYYVYIKGLFPPYRSGRGK